MKNKPQSAILHYTAPPIMGGVEAVIQAHSRELILNGHDVTIIAGRGHRKYVEDGLPWGARLKLIPQMDSLDPTILRITNDLNNGIVPKELNSVTDDLRQVLNLNIQGFDNVFIHNLWTKHFNLPLTIALYQIFDSGSISNLINWCHDFTWGSLNSGHKVHPGYPWDLLRTFRENATYVVGSRKRQGMLAELIANFIGESVATMEEKIRVIPNGVNPSTLIGLSDKGNNLVERMNLLNSDLILLMPVRISQAKNIKYALKVIRELKTFVKNPKLVITGPPDPHNREDIKRYKDLKKQVYKLGIENEVHFVFDSGVNSYIPNLIDHETVGDLIRVSDVVFMPSHREGFGIPIFEAGLLRIPVWCSSNVPAATEIKSEGINIFDLSKSSIDLAREIHDALSHDAQHILRREIRQKYTWNAIYQNNIKDLVSGTR